MRHRVMDARLKWDIATPSGENRLKITIKRMTPHLSNMKLTIWTLIIFIDLLFCFIILPHHLKNTLGWFNVLQTLLKACLSLKSAHVNTV